jgi:hypothetical protein
MPTTVSALHLVSPPSPGGTALDQLWRARRTFGMALLRWLEEGPPPADIAVEVDGTIAVVRQLAAFAGWRQQ